jgi:DNA repair protein RadC
LLGILLHNSTRQKTAVDIAKEVLRLGKDNLTELGRLSLKELTKIKGIGEAKAITLIAALELGRIRQAAASLARVVVTSISDIADYLKATLKNYRNEVFAVLFFNRTNKINHLEILSEGGITGTVADPRIIRRNALQADAVSLILCHNHPSGSLKHSRADQPLTTKIKEAASFLDIMVIDHIIVSEGAYYSFSDEGIL